MSTSYNSNQQQRTLQGSPASAKVVQQALEMARESAEAARDPTVSAILEEALTTTWDKVRNLPNHYVMTRDEFAVFNYFQHRFVGEEIAAAARKRYWDNATHSWGRNGW